MPCSGPGVITQLLRDLEGGDAAALNRLVETIYDDLRRIAQRLMRQERPDSSSQPTSLVHETFLRLFRDEDFVARASEADRRYVYGAVSRAMRQILVERARQRRSEKRGGRMIQHPFDVVLDRYQRQNLDVEEFRRVVDEMSPTHPRAAAVMTLRGCGFTQDEVAEQLGVSLSTVESDFRFARAWLRRQLNCGG